MYVNIILAIRRVIKHDAKHAGRSQIVKDLLPGHGIRLYPEINVKPLENFNHEDVEPHTAWLNMSSGIMRGILVSA